MISSQADGHCRMRLRFGRVGDRGAEVKLPKARSASATGELRAPGQAEGPRSQD